MSLTGLAENICLLYKLNQKPEQPHDNPEADISSTTSSHRSLKFKHELEIANALSFLSAYTDDSSKVSALCIEELPNENGLLINVAANTGDVQRLRQALANISTILMDEAASGKSMLLVSLM